MRWKFGKLKTINIYYSTIPKFILLINFYFTLNDDYSN